MAKTVRLSDEEQEAIRIKAVALNKKLMEKNKQPLRDSEVVHAVALLHKDLKVKTSHIYSNLSDNSGMWSA
ncbi:hypothetical protein VP468_03475 [Acinetobacter baumannii]|uniref:hypothetical protein n=1 Tax=Acinetobacter baumannii TaxID=470 RepID=UPI0030DF64BC|nr:hypothetical protein VP468_03475 [Acinetobacter baumannii]